MVILLTVTGYLLGAIPFSVLIGKLALGKDIRQYGDGNPGATNVQRAGGGTRWFVAAFLSDFAKGMLIPGIAYWGMGIDDWRIVPIALAPVLGHAFSVFLGFTGGKAVAVSFGIWAGLTLAIVPTLLGGLLVLAVKTVDVDGWAVILAFAPISLVLALFFNPLFLLVWAGNLLILAFKHRQDLVRVPHLKAQPR